MESVAVGVVFCSDSADELTKDYEVNVKFFDKSKFVEHSPDKAAFLVSFWDIDSIERPICKDVWVKTMADQNFWGKLV